MAQNNQRMVKIVIWIIVATMTLTFLAALLPAVT